jgi:hypothetical protein
MALPEVSAGAAGTGGTVAQMFVRHSSNDVDGIQIEDAWRDRLHEKMDGPVRAAATLHSEYLGPLPRLTAHTGPQTPTFLLAPLVRDYLPEVVTSPARAAGIATDRELVTRLVTTAPAAGEAIPLLPSSSGSRRTGSNMATPRPPTGKRFRF